MPEPAASVLKPQYGWSWVALLPPATWSARLAIKWGLSANQVSWLSVVPSLAALVPYTLLPDSIGERIGVAFLFALGTMLDIADGYVARATGSVGNYGAYLDASLDLVRFNAFAIVVAVVKMQGIAEWGAVAAYALLFNLSFARMMYNIGRGPKNRPANDAYERLLPKRYREFCLRHRLMYSPFNFEDQVLLYIFTIGVLFRAEVQVIWFCLVIRIFEVSLGLVFRRRGAKA